MTKTEFLKSIGPNNPLQNPNQLIPCGCAVGTWRNFICILPSQTVHEDLVNPRGIYQCRGCKTTVVVSLSQVKRACQWQEAQVNESERLKKIDLKRFRNRLETNNCTKNHPEADNLWRLARKYGLLQMVQSFESRRPGMIYEHKSKDLWHPLRYQHTTEVYEELTALIS